MSCTTDNKPDWKAYALGELAAAERREAEAHAESCAWCREELAMLRLTLDALPALREEEVPRRIAFVSDPVFEPKWWQRLFWNPTFAAAALVAAAIVAHGAMTPQGLTEEEVQAHVQAEIKAVLADVQMDFDQQRNLMAAMYQRTLGMERE